MSISCLGFLSSRPTIQSFPPPFPPSVQKLCNLGEDWLESSSWGLEGLSWFSCCVGPGSPLVAASGMTAPGTTCGCSSSGDPGLVVPWWPSLVTTAWPPTGTCCGALTAATELSHTPHLTCRCVVCPGCFHDRQKSCGHDHPQEICVIVQL